MLSLPAAAACRKDDANLFESLLLVTLTFLLFYTQTRFALGSLDNNPVARVGPRG